MVNGVKNCFMIIVPLVITLLSSIGYSEQQSAVVSAETNVKGVSILLIDATDMGWGLGGEEIMNLGNVDAWGRAVSGAPYGDPNVNGIVGIPVDATGAPLSSSSDPGCIGAFYPFFPGTGKNSNNQHLDSAICLFLMTFNQWRISTSARLVRASPGVTVNQLKWKMDETPARGSQNYIDFTPNEYTVATGFGARQFLYLDLGLLVEYEDGTGPNTWVITYTFITD